jgi:patatin-like phospholipase/acyl hydrolase
MLTEQTNCLLTLFVNQFMFRAPKNDKLYLLDIISISTTAPSEFFQAKRMGISRTSHTNITVDE